jgi:hypothetical protein
MVCKQVEEAFGWMKTAWVDQGSQLRPPLTLMALLQALTLVVGCGMNILPDGPPFGPSP